MSSMPHLVSGDQDDSATEVILGVDTHSDVHVAAVITALGVLLDAEAAACAVLSGRASGSAKTGDGPVEILRMLKMAKDCAVKPAARRSINSKPYSWRPTQPCVRHCRA